MFQGGLEILRLREFRNYTQFSWIAYWVSSIVISKIPTSQNFKSTFKQSNLHIPICQTQITFVISLWDTLKHVLKGLLLSEFKWCNESFAFRLFRFFCNVMCHGLKSFLKAEPRGWTILIFSSKYFFPICT